MRSSRRRRLEIPGHFRYLTFSCRSRLPLFANDAIKDEFASHLAIVRDARRFDLFAWVVMPEHVHLLIKPRLPEEPLTQALSHLKRPFAEKVIRRWRELDAPVLTKITDSHGRTRFWERGGGYDRNIYTAEELLEKINYINENPARRGLVERPEQWAWSSARWYAGERDGPVPIDPIH